MRPAYQDEFEALEKDLEKLYEQYVLKFRNLSYLESQVNELERHEREQLDQVEIQVRALTDKLRDSQQDRGDEVRTRISQLLWWNMLELNSTVITRLRPYNIL